MTRRKRRASGAYVPEARRGEFESPVVVSAGYPQDLLAAIDDARGDTDREAWLVEAARQRLKRDEQERIAAAITDEYLELLRAGVPLSDPRQVALAERLSEWVRGGSPVRRLSDEGGARAREWFGEAQPEEKRETGR